MTVIASHFIRRLLPVAAALGLCFLVGCPQSEPSTAVTEEESTPVEDTRTPRNIQGTDLPRQFETYSPKFDIFIPEDVSKGNICASLWDQYATLVANASSCSTTADCFHALQNRMPCTCETYVSDPSIEGLAGALTTAFDDEYDCMVGVACGACPPQEFPLCQDGTCTAINESQGSKTCENPDDCIPVSGCACGCWSHPPADPGPECPCAAPSSCDCVDGVCN